MFSGEVPEKLIADKTGQHSLQSFRSYEGPQSNMKKATDKVIANSIKSVITKRHLRDNHGTSIATKYVTPSSTTNKQNPESTSSSSESVYGTEHVFSGTLTNCTIINKTCIVILIMPMI